MGNVDGSGQRTPTWYTRPPSLHDDTARTPPAGRQPAPPPVPVQGHLALGELDGGGVAQLPPAAQRPARDPSPRAARRRARGPRRTRRIPPATPVRARRPAAATPPPPRPPACGAGRAGRRRAGRGRTRRHGTARDQGRDQLGLPGGERGRAVDARPGGRGWLAPERATRRSCRGGRGSGGCGGDRVELGVQRGGGRVAAVAFEHHRGGDVEPLAQPLQQGEHAGGTGSVCVSW